MSALAGLLAFIIGAAAGYALSIAAYTAYIALTGTLDREGALAMGVAFAIGPAVALVCGIVAAVWAIRRFRLSRAVR